MKVISWNLLRLEGAAVEDVAALLERERPDVLRRHVPEVMLDYLGAGLDPARVLKGADLRGVVFTAVKSPTMTVV